MGRPYRAAKAFTLVELLVVVGIIAVLIGMLLPSLGKARQQAATAKCLANLRSIGHGLHVYAAEHKGYLVPGWVANDAGSGNGLDNYATILVGLRYLPAPNQDQPWDADTRPDDSVFRCPAAGEKKHELPGDWPASPTDPIGGFAWRRQSVTGAGGWSRSGVIVDTWYGVNMLDNVDVDKQRAWPFRKIKRLAAGGIEGQLSKLTEFRNASALALMFDGLRYLHGDVTRTNFRHNGGRTANFLFADGHCESLPASVLPTLTPAQMRGDTAPELLKSWPVPRWRTDQQ